MTEFFVGMVSHNRKPQKVTIGKRDGIGRGKGQEPSI
jgi:hypothetical protein